MFSVPAWARSGGSDNSFKYGVLKVNPTSVSFGNVQVGQSATATATLSNIGKGNLTVYYATMSGTGFTTGGLNVPLTLTPNQSYTFSITFAPQSGGNATGTITLSSQNRHSSRDIPLSGSGIAAGQLTASPATLDFGSVTVGQSKSLTGTLTASGASVIVSSGTSSSAEFVLSGLSFPFTLGAGQSASYAMAFTPQTGGSASATLTFESDSTNSPTVQSLIGTGNPPQHHTVDLSWDPSTSVVAGYDVYRSGTSGGPYTKINSALDTGTTYADGSVESGQTYYYVTTAVDDNGNESGYSNEVQALIPSP
ncbi:MAG TPA: choice-of-anchor D domain-containing protein [Terriglobales bacterium]|jgi:hypothetical protein|nr:choice-of-anchor D domain-containing protein [Terriglobales bacterium]